MSLTHTPPSLSGAQHLRYLPKTCDKTEGGPCDACAMLNDLDARIADTRAQLEEQLKARWAILRKVNQRHDPMASLLPVEVAADIFKRCLPSLPSPESLLKKSSDSGVDWSTIRKKLTSINWNWRAIACSTPNIWSSFNILVYLRDNDLFQQDLAAIRRNFERSGDLPLTIRVEIDSSRIYEDQPPTTLQLFELLFSQAHRWEHLSITAPDCILAAISKYISTFPKGLNAPHLSHFCLFSSNHTSWDYFDQWDPSLISTNPNAHFPTPLYIHTPDATLAMNFLDFSHLRQLNAGCLTESEIPHLLSFSPHITSLKCWTTLSSRSISSTTVEDPELRGRILHAAMKSFSVDGYSSDLFAWITMPAVENLYCDANPVNIRLLCDFLIRSQCSLTTLDVFSSECTDEELIGVLDLTPHIRQLTIRGSPPGPRLFQHFGQTAHIPGTEPTSFLPHLRSFSVCTRHTIEDFDWLLLHTVVPMAPPAKTFCRPLLEIGIEIGRHQKQMRSEDVSIVVDLINRGVDIKIWILVDGMNEELHHEDGLIWTALERLRARR